jgi:hypothetical protein
MQPSAIHENLARRFRIEPGAACARLGPLPLEAALAGVGWHCDLLVPAKFAVSRSGAAEIQAEIPLVAAPRTCEQLADAALDAAVDGPLAGFEHPARRPALADDEIESALSQLPWSFRRTDAGSHQIDATPAPGHAMRVTLAREGTTLRVSTTTSVRTVSPEIARALAYFALESNDRLRLARIGVRPGDEGAAIVWDWVVPEALPAAGAIPPVVEAVVFAQMLTRRPLRALADPSVAAAYLRHRPAAQADPAGEVNGRAHLLHELEEAATATGAAAT